MCRKSQHRLEESTGVVVSAAGGRSIRRTVNSRGGQLTVRISSVKTVSVLASLNSGGGRSVFKIHTKKRIVGNSSPWVCVVSSSQVISELPKEERMFPISPNVSVERC